MANITQVNYSQVLKKRWGFITIVTLAVLLLSLAFTLIQPFKYKSEVKILVIQQTAPGFDAYSASKSAERIGKNLAQIVYSSSFLSKILTSDFAIDKSFFPVEEDKKREFWGRTVAADVPSGSTILIVEVYHVDQKQAATIASAIAGVLTKDVDEYVGTGDVTLTVVDQPLTSNYPVQPNIVLNLVLGLVLGLFLAIAIVLVTYTEKVEVNEVYRSRERSDIRRQKKGSKRSKPSRFKSQDYPVIENEQGDLELPDVEQALGLDQEPGRTKHFDKKLEAENQVEEGNGAKREIDYEKLPSFSEEDEIRTMYED